SSAPSGLPFPSPSPSPSPLSALMRDSEATLRAVQRAAAAAHERLRKLSRAQWKLRTAVRQFAVQTEDSRGNLARLAELLDSYRDAHAQLEADWIAQEESMRATLHSLSLLTVPQALLD